MHIPANLAKRWLQWPAQETLLLFQSTVELDLFSNYLINFSAVDDIIAKFYWPFSLSYIDRHYFNNIYILVLFPGCQLCFFCI